MIFCGKQAKRKRIAELSVGTLPMENRRKSHWDFVLEEMTWLANDFAQVCFFSTSPTVLFTSSVFCRFDGCLSSRDPIECIYVQMCPALSQMQLFIFLVYFSKYLFVALTGFLICNNSTSNRSVFGRLLLLLN